MDDVHTAPEPEEEWTKSGRRVENESKKET
jgi:hypothetical protein